MDNKKIIELNAINLIDAEPLFMTKTQVMAELGISRVLADRYINAFKEETEEGHIFPQGAYIEINNKSRWIHRKAFYYFLSNYNALQDTNARKYIKPFNPNDENLIKLYK